MSHPAIKVENLHRTYGNLKAVEGVSFAVEPGQVVGFVGANGAGKTTTMRILATLEAPTLGNAYISGINVYYYPTQVRRLIGWMPDHFGTYNHMTVMDYLDFYARAMGYSGAEREKRVREVMEFTDLISIGDRLIDKLSKGMGQRLCLGRSLVHDPSVLIMDEPAAGLDPRARVELKQLIRILADEGKTIFISSHILGELQEMCDSLLFINNGKIVHHGSADDLLNVRSELSVVHVELASEKSRLPEWAEMNPHVRYVEDTKRGGRIEIEGATPERISEVLKRMIQAGLLVTDFHREERRLEDAFIEILGNLERDEKMTLSEMKHQLPEKEELPS